MAQVRFRTRTGKIVSFGSSGSKSRKGKGKGRKSKARRRMSPITSRCRRVRMSKPGCSIVACERQNGQLAFKKGTSQCGGSGIRSDWRERQDQMEGLRGRGRSRRRRSRW